MRKKVLVRRARTFTAAVLLGTLAVASPPTVMAQEAEPDAPAGAQERASVLPDLPPIVADDPLPNDGPLSPPEVLDTEPLEETALDRAFAEAAESGEAVPVEELWTETSAIYAEPEGFVTERISGGPVRVEAEDGAWVPIDPTLVETDEGIAPVATPSDVVISDGGSEPLVEVTDPTGDGADPADESVAVDVAGTLPAPELEGATATYAGALDGSDLVVTAKNVGIEVSVVIPDADAAQESYELAVAAEGFEVSEGEHGGLVFTDADGEEVGSQTAPIMFDAAAQPIPGVAANPGAVSSELVERDGQLFVRITPDADYLADPDTEYPVTIDPVTDFSMAADTMVAAGTPTTAYDTSTRLYVGTNGFTGVSRTFMKFGTTAFESSEVITASLKVYQDWSGTGSCTATPVNVYESTYFNTAGTTWNTRPGVVGTPAATVNTAGDLTACATQVGWKTFNITSLAETWEDNADTWGALGMTANETNAAHAKSFWSRETANPPEITISYNITPDTPSGLSPANNAIVSTLQPKLKATLNVPNWTGDVYGFFKVFDDASNELAGDFVTVDGGDVAEWQVPDKELRVGRTYTWQVTACTGQYPQSTCSATVTRTFTVNPGLAAGNRQFFTYDSTGLTDTSGIQVNVATGNLSVNALDLSVRGNDSALSFTRTYNSLGRENSTMGHRWSTSYASNVRLVPEPDGSFIYYGPSGEAVKITKNGSTYTPSGDLDARFTDGTGYFGVYVLEFNHDRGEFKAGDQLLFHHPDSPTPQGPSYALWGKKSRNGHEFVIDYSGTTPTIVEVTGSTSARDVAHTMASGRITSRTLGSGGSARSVSYAYDGNGDLNTVTDATGVVTDYDYTGHLLTKITIQSSAGNRVIDITYDSVGRAKTITRTVAGVSEQTSYTYDDSPSSTDSGLLFLTEVENARNKVSEFYSDFSGRVREAYNADGDKVATDFDDNSNVKTVSNNNATPFTFGWSGDSRNNLESVKQPTGAEATSSYDGTATTGLQPYQPESSTDAQGHTTDFTFDSAGNLQRFDLPGTAFSDVVRHGIDGGSCTNAVKGQPCSGRNADMVTTSFTYDSAHNMASVDNPTPLGTWTFSYNSYGETTGLVDGRSTARTFTYDKVGRLLTALYGSTADVIYDYDDFGNNIQRTDPDNTDWYLHYDAANRLQDIDGPTPPSPYRPDLYDVDFDYDTVGNLVRLDDAGGVTTYTFDDINMVRTITDPDSNVTTYDYNAPQQGTWLTDIDYPNGATTEMDYDTSGRITAVETRKAGGALIIDQAVTWKDTGNKDRAVRQKIAEQGGVTAYTYDDGNRLKTSIMTLTGGAPGASYSYNWDSVGNMTSSTENGASQSFTPNDADQLTGTGLAYDGNGNMTGGGSHGYTSMTYNILDQATSVTPKTMSARTEEYGGQLQSLWLRDATTRFGTAASLGITATETPTTFTSFVRDPSGRLVSYEEGSTRRYYHHDNRGSVKALTDSSGNLVQSYDYTPFGRIAAGTFGSVVQPFRWNGEYALSDYNYKIGGRWYDASVGRWTQRDPSGAEPNAYAFGRGDPINRADPSGLISISVSGCVIVCGEVSVGVDEDGVALGAGTSAGAAGGGDVSITTGSSETGASVNASCSGGGATGSVSYGTGGAGVDGGVTTGTEVGCTVGVSGQVRVLEF